MTSNLTTPTMAAVRTLLQNSTPFLLVTG